MLRKLIEHRLRMRGIHDDDAYICSLSSRTLVYKGQLTPEQARWGGSWRVGRGQMDGGSAVHCCRVALLMLFRAAANRLCCPIACRLPTQCPTSSCPGA